MTTTNTTMTAMTSAFNATVEFLTPLASVLGATSLELGKASVYTVEATAGTALQVSTGLRMGAQALANMAPKTAEEAESNWLILAAMTTDMLTTDSAKAE